MNVRAAPQETRRDASRPHGLVIHAGGDWPKRIEAGEVTFFSRLIRHATSQAMSSRVVAAGGSTSGLLLSQDHVHLLVGGPPGYGPGRLHAGPGHIRGFWTLDEIGTGWHSSLRFARFRPEEIDAAPAAHFFDGVTGYMLRENVSNLAQQPRVDQPLPPAAAAIFCQPEPAAGEEPSHYLTTAQMIRVTAATCTGETVYVKPHPRQPMIERRAIMDLAADHPNLVVTDASVHDLARAARMVVTRNSSAGFEALMQRRCVITCGKSDYWHATLTPKKEADLHDALVYGAEEMAGFPYEKYLYWVLDRNGLEPAKAIFARRAWARIRDKALF